MATVESSDMDVVAELGVPLVTIVSKMRLKRKSAVEGATYGMSEGVTGSEGGGGRLMRVGADIATKRQKSKLMIRYGALSLDSSVLYCQQQRRGS